ncbi:MAG: hypothetical protein HY851_05730 [candidate division Zixibacteria bacterium]|nr:hypothetical protein [candidate division Zixibacteria bacterium]
MASHRGEFRPFRRSKAPDAEINWLVGRLRNRVLGYVPLAQVRRIVNREVTRG